MATMEVHLGPGADPIAAKRAIKARMEEAFDLDHATVEVDMADADPTISREPSAREGV